MGKKTILSFLIVSIIAANGMSVYADTGASVALAGIESVYEKPEKSTDGYTGEEEPLTTEEQSKEDLKVLEELNKLKEEMKEELSSGKIEEYKNTAKKYLFMVIDFLFFGEEINDVTLNQISEEAKKTIIEDTTEVYNTLNEMFPEETALIAEYYGKTKEELGKLIKNASEAFKEFMGPNYDSFVEAWDDIKEGALDLWHSITGALGDAYEEYRDEPTNEEPTLPGYGVLRKVK